MTTNNDTTTTTVDESATVGEQAVRTEQPNVCFLSDGVTVLTEYILSDERTGTTDVGAMACGPEKLYCGYSQVPIPCAPVRPDSLPLDRCNDIRIDNDGFEYCHVEAAVTASVDPVNMTLPETGSEPVILGLGAILLVIGMGLRRLAR